MSATEKNLDPQIHSLLAGLRWRIRAYVWLEGVSLGVIWLGLTFWAGLALDYLPVLAGASEMPWVARLVLLGIIALVLAFIFYRWVFRRIIVRLADRSMAVLLERRFANFHDSLVTSVELTERPDHAETFSPDMLDHTTGEALSGTGSVRLRRVFSYSPLVRSVFGAAVLLVTIVVFYFINNEALATWARRIYLLKDEPWPRNALIEVVGIELLGDEESAERLKDLPMIPFTNRHVKVAKGSNVRLKVHSDLGAEVVPKVCTIRYRTEEGERGRVTMNRTKAQGRYQDYSFSGKPLRGILSTVNFDVVGYDFRVRDYTIEVVDSPAVTGVELDCKFPEYMVDEALSSWLPRTVDLTNATQLPIGTDVTVRASTNKSLQRVDLYNPDTKETTTLTIEGDDDQRRRFEYRTSSLDANLTLDVTLYDVDNVITERPYRIFIAAIPDEEPKVEVNLRGIGTAVTPDVIVPIEGQISDDYAVAKAWFDVGLERASTADGAPKTANEMHEFPVGDAGKVDASLDFRNLRSQEDGLELKPKDKLVLTIKAADKYDLGDSPNEGSGDRRQLDVVDSDTLLAMLEAREIGLRRRFEQIVEEMTQARDFLKRVESPTGDRGAEPEDAAAAGDEPDDEKLDEQKAAQRAQSLRLLSTQQALQQTRKSAQELLGVAASFHDIREELINNRVDTEDRKNRLKELVADPMQMVGEVMFPELERRADRLEKVLLADLNAKRYDVESGGEEAKGAVEQADDILAEMQEILQRMLDLETYNELLDIVRAIAKDQEGLIEDTTEEEKKGKKNLLRDSEK